MPLAPYKQSIAASERWHSPWQHPKRKLVKRGTNYFKTVTAAAQCIEFTLG